MNFFFFFLLLISLLIIYRTIAIWYNCKRKMEKYLLSVIHKYTYSEQFLVPNPENSSSEFRRDRSVTFEREGKLYRNSIYLQGISVLARSFQKVSLRHPFFSPFSLLLACVGATWLRHKARLERGKRIYEGVFTGVTSRSRDALLLIDDRNLKNIAFL